MGSDSPKTIAPAPSTGPTTTPPSAWSAFLRRHDTWFVAIFLGALTFVAYPRVFLKGEVISPASILYSYAPWDRLLPADAILPKNNVLSDEIDSTIPEVEYLRQRLLQGDIPAWRDITSNGTPMFWIIINQLMVAPLLLLVLIFDTAQGLSIFGLSGGAILDDFDGDGRDEWPSSSRSGVARSWKYASVCGARCSALYCAPLSCESA